MNNLLQGKYRDHESVLGGILETSLAELESTPVRPLNPYPDENVLFISELNFLPFFDPHLLERHSLLQLVSYLDKYYQKIKFRNIFSKTKFDFYVTEQLAHLLRNKEIITFTPRFLSDADAPERIRGKVDINLTSFFNRTGYSTEEMPQPFPDYLVKACQLAILQLFAPSKAPRTYKNPAEIHIEELACIGKPASEDPTKCFPATFALSFVLVIETFHKLQKLNISQFGVNHEGDPVPDSMFTHVDRKNLIKLKSTHTSLKLELPEHYMDKKKKIISQKNWA